MPQVNIGIYDSILTIFKRAHTSISKCYYEISDSFIQAPNVMGNFLNFPILNN